MKYKNIIVWLLVIVIGIAPVYAADSISQEEIQRADLTLEQMLYEHIEYSEIENLINEARNIVKQNNQVAFYKWENTYYKLFCKLQFMIQLAHLKYELNTDQKEYFDEYLYSVDLMGKMKTQYIALFEGQETLSDNMDQYYELSIERDKLVEEYYNQQMNVKISLKGEEKNIIEVLKTESLSKTEMLQYYDEWYTAYNQAAGEIFLKLVTIDNQIAKLEGYDSYAAYMYEGYERDYTIEESKRFFESVKKWAPSLLGRLYDELAKNSDELTAYTYTSENNLLNTIRTSFISQHEELEEAYNYLIQYNLYDIEARENKESGGFTVYLEEVAEPFILLNYTSPYQTVLSFIHEFGHYFSYFQIGAHEGGLDLDETYSQSLELLAIPSYKTIFGNDEIGDEAALYVITSLIEAIIDGCLYDEFLQQVYSHPDMTVEELNTLYVELARAYGIRVDERSWCEVSHNFEMPFYYLSYSISAVAALEIWGESVENPDRGMETYLRLVEAGKDSSFMEALEKVGLTNPLEEKALQYVAVMLESYLSEEESERAA